MIVNIDFAPTLIDMAGIDVPADMQGKSFKNMLSGYGRQPWRDAMYYHYYEYPEPHRVAPHFGVRTERYKLIRFYGPHDRWELFDLEKDRAEVNNLINDSAMKEVVASLKKKLMDLIIQYKDKDALQIIRKG